MILSKEEVWSMIPQKTPFVMVGALEEVSDASFKTSFDILSDNVLLENGAFSEAGLMENIAQSCATGLGFLDKQSGVKEKIGFIGAISKMKLYSKPCVGDSISTHVEVKSTFENIILVQGTSFLREEKLLECEMKVVLMEN